MTKKDVAKQYISFLEQGYTEGIIALFTEEGQVSSPIYGEKRADIFYENLKADTLNSKLELKGIFEDENSNKIAIHFNYIWTLKNKSTVEFDVVDIIEFNSNHKIVHLQIIYDTVKSRALVNV